MEIELTQFVPESLEIVPESLEHLNTFYKTIFEIELKRVRKRLDTEDQNYILQVTYTLRRKEDWPSVRINGIGYV
jgi:hypothetical protein